MRELCKLGANVDEALFGGISDQGQNLNHEYFSYQANIMQENSLHNEGCLIGIGLS